MLKRIVDFEVTPPPAKENRGLVALVASAIVHAVVILLLVFGIPVSGAASLAQVPATVDPQPIALQPPGPHVKPLPKVQQRPNTPQPPPPPPPPPMKEVALGPDSKRPDDPAKEAAAKQSDANAAAAKAKAPDPAPKPADEPAKPEPQPPAPQRLQVPKPGDYTGVGALPMPTTSPWGPPKLDSASGAPPTAAPNVPTGTFGGRAGLANHDPQKWENSFDDQTSGRCVEIPELGKNSDGSPVLATVLGRVLAPDGRTPMGGAHLQILGTTFGTFSDNNGEYRLPFDPHMLAKCRVQYVIVDAPGYKQERLTLMIGPRVRSDDVVLRKH